MKIFRLAFILALTLCPAPRLHAVLVDGIMAIVNNTAITRQQVENFAAPAINALRRQYADDPVDFQQALTGVLTNSLELLVERQLILHAFTAEGYRMPESYLDELVRQRIRSEFGGNRVTLMKTLQAEGETFEQWRSHLRDQTIETYMRSKNVAQEIVVSPYRIEQYYDKHQDDFKVGNEAKLRLIVLNKNSPDDTNTVDLAREIREKIKAGASFAEMATIYSQGPQRSQGGERGWIGRGVLRKKLDDAAFSLQPGRVSNVINTPDACYLMQVEQRRAAHVKPLNRPSASRSRRAWRNSGSTG